METGYDANMLAIAAQGAAAVANGATLSCGPFAGAYRRLALPGHPNASDDAIDLAFVSAARAFGGAELLAANAFTLERPVARTHPAVVTSENRVVMRGPRRATAAADAFTFALGLSVESAKVTEALSGHATFDNVANAAVALGSNSGALASTLGPKSDDVLGALHALARGGADRQVVGACPPDEVDVEALARSVGSRDAGPLFVVVGAYERVHDLLSPFVRALANDLNKLTTTKFPDALYEAADAVFAFDPGALYERVDQEQKDGFTQCGSAMVLRCESMNPRRCDFRANAAATALARGRARIVFAPDATALTHVLATVGERVRAIILLSEGRLPAGASARPSVLLDASTQAAMDVNNALLGVKEIGTGDLPTVALSVPSLGLAPSEVPSHFVVDTGLATLAFACASSRAMGHLAQTARIAHAIFPPADATAPTEVALRVLERMASAPATRR